MFDNVSRSIPFLCLGLIFFSFIAFAVHNQSKHAYDQYKYIAAYKFPDSVVADLRANHPDWSDEAIKYALCGLKEYFLAIRHARAIFKGKQILGMTSVLADEAWHSFLKNYKAYNAFCIEGFGSVLEHIPDKGATPSLIKSKDSIGMAARSTFLSLSSMYKRGEYNKFILDVRKMYLPVAAATVLAVPLLFSLDKMFLGEIPGAGWIYSDDAINQLSAMTFKEVLNNSGASCGSSSCGAALVCGSSCAGCSCGGSGGSSCGGGCSG
jgi:uncharacterized membrane protein YgcG